MKVNDHDPARVLAKQLFGKLEKLEVWECHGPGEPASAGGRGRHPTRFTRFSGFEDGVPE